MRDALRGWRPVGAAAFVGAVVVPMVAIGVYGTLTMAALSEPMPDAPSPGIRPGFVLVQVAFGLALLVAIPGLALAIYRDATTLEGSWEPDARRWGVLALLYPFSLLVTWVYLRRRYRHECVGYLAAEDTPTAEQVAGSRWWYAVALGPVALLCGLAVFLVPSGGLLTFAGDLVVRTGLGSAIAAVGLAGFYVGLAVDVRQVRDSDGEWTPGVRRYQLPTLVPAALPLVAAVYLLNRHRHLGVP